jgi:cytochrome b involved in lipid metabolism
MYMKKSLIVLASVLLLIGAGCEERFEGATRSTSETQEVGGSDQRKEESSDGVKKEGGSRLEDGDDVKKGGVENENEGEDEKKPNDDDRATPAPTPAPPTGASGSPKSYAMADVAMHKDAKSCWTVVNGSVYDVTSWIGKHPGGSVAIITLCGREASKDFGEQHSGERRPEQELARFRIGDLKQQ